jgi:hypothetical protein
VLEARVRAESRDERLLKGVLGVVGADVATRNLSTSEPTLSSSA